MIDKHSCNTSRQGLLLGWESSPSGGLAPVIYTGDAPLLTSAPTGSGKGRGALIPNAILHPGSLISVDPKGEITQVVARRRVSLGQKLVVIDPFHVVWAESDGLNPLDLLELPGSDFEADSEMLASLLADGHHDHHQPYFSNSATALLSGLIAHIASANPPGQRHFGRLREWLYHADMDYAIAKELDEGKVKSRLAHEKFVAYLAAPFQETRPCIRSMACMYVHALSSEGVRRTLQRSSFRLEELVDGVPLSIFIVVPPEKLDSHKSLLRLWVGTLLTALCRRKRIPRQRTLLLLDECSQLGTLPALRQAVTLLRGSGVQVWSIWQDLSQLRLLYPLDWQSMVNNSAVLQVFGVNNNLMAREWGDLFGREPSELLRMRPRKHCCKCMAKAA